MLSIVLSLLFLLLNFMSVNASEVRSSLIKWNKINSSTWFNFTKWKSEEKFKEINPSWYKFEKEKSLNQLMGVIIDKVGSCRVLTESGSFLAEFRSQLFKGYEVKAAKDSICWIMMIDGSLVRVAPQSSISLNEFKLGEKKYLFFFRINNGNILFISRSRSKFRGNNLGESDKVMLPPLLLKAQIGFKKRTKPIDFLKLPSRVKSVFTKLNSEIEKNNEHLDSYKSKFLFSTGMGAVTCSGDIILDHYVNWGRGIIVKQRESFKDKLNSTKRTEGKCHIILKNNINNHELYSTTEMPLNSWQFINTKGEIIGDYNNPYININEYLTSNIPSMYLAREFFFKKYLKIFNNNTDLSLLQKTFGLTRYHLLHHGESLIEKRFSFLKKYVIKVEGLNYSIARKRKIDIFKNVKPFSDPAYFHQFYEMSFRKNLFYKPYQKLENINFQVLNSTKKNMWNIINARSK